MLQGIFGRRGVVHVTGHAGSRCRVSLAEGGFGQTGGMRVTGRFWQKRGSACQGLFGRGMMHVGFVCLKGRHCMSQSIGVLLLHGLFGEGGSIAC